MGLTRSPAGVSLLVTVCGIFTIWGGEGKWGVGGGARQVLSTSTRRLSSSCTAILSSRHDGADLSGLLVRAADDGLLEVLGPLLLGARVPMIIHRAGLAAIARPEDEAEDHDSADDGTCASERRVSSDPADDARSCRAGQRGKVARDSAVRSCAAVVSRATRGARAVPSRGRREAPPP